MAWVRTGVLACAVLSVGSPAAARSELLPLERVRFYETGVAYFERTGTLGTDAVTLPVPASHLDDALKTLVVYAKDGPSQLEGVEFSSSVSRGMAKALAGLEPDATRLGLVTLLESLRGSSVELTLRDATVSGRLVDVLTGEESDLETCVPASTNANAKNAKPNAETGACTPRPLTSLVVMTATHELRRVALRDVLGVRPLDAAFGARLGAALDALSGGSARVLKDLRVLAHGHSVSLGYVSEAPVWRASYRLVLDDAGKEAALQGWALVHNDTDESWRRVSVELVNGRPDSFLFPLAAPRYAERELVTPEHELSTVPQLMRTTPDAMWTPGDEETYGSGELSFRGVGQGGGGRGEGIGLGSIGTLGHGAGNGPSEDTGDGFGIGNLAGVAAAEGVESGALFRYTLAGKLDLAAHASALVPFLGERVNARAIALFSAPGSDARSAVYLTYGGAQTLPPGTIAVFGDGGFAGETALPRLKPHATATLEYGADLDVSLEQKSDEQRDEPHSLGFEPWALIEHYVRHHHVEDRLENRSGMPRSAFLVLPYVNNATVRGADEIAYDSEHQRACAVFALAARGAADRKLDVDEGLVRKHAVSQLTSAELTELAVTTSLPAEQRAIVRDAAALLARAETKRRELARARANLALREAEATRFREHARALGAARGTEQVVARLLAAEDRAEEARRAIRALTTEVDTLARATTRTLMRLSG
ncbi:MAG TPA: hypothetical protein VMI54_13135 [Polyangiaceae bacterium]|nr:hypothetical protein [Polyangiaceae bacterium]